MVLVSKGYVIKEFDDIEKAFQYIKEDLDKEGLSYQKVFDKCDGKMQVLVYQYWTLYTEVYIIHRDYDLRR